MNRQQASCLGRVALLFSLSAVGCANEDFVVQEPSTPGTNPAAESPAAKTPDGEKPADPAAAAPVVVSILGVNGMPQANVPVVFHDASGAVIGETTTKDDGKASSAGLATPAMVSALLGDEKSKHVLTWTTVKAGDVLDASNYSWGAEDVGSYAVAMPAPMPGVSHYRGYVGKCISFGAKAATSFGVAVKPDCVRAGDRNDVLVLAYGDLTTQIGYAYAKNQSAPYDQKIEVPTNAFVPMDALDVVVSNVPQSATAETEVMNVANGVQIDRGYLPLKGEKGTFPVAAGFADSFQINAAAHGEDLLVTGFHTVSKRVTWSTLQSNVDFANRLPNIIDRSIDVTDPTRPTLKWASSSSLAATDGGHVSIRFFLDNAAIHGWTLLVAPNATSVKLPALPASAAAWAPAQNMTINGPHVLFVESDAFADHDAFRRTAGRVMPLGTTESYGFTVRKTMLPSAGMTLRGTEL